MMEICFKLFFCLLLLVLSGVYAQHNPVLNQGSQARVNDEDGYVVHVMTLSTSLKDTEWTRRDEQPIRYQQTSGVPQPITNQDSAQMNCTVEKDHVLAVISKEVPDGDVTNQAAFRLTNCLVESSGQQRPLHLLICLPTGLPTITLSGVFDIVTLAFNMILCVVLTRSFAF